MKRLIKLNEFEHKLKSYRDEILKKIIDKGLNYEVSEVKDRYDEYYEANEFFRINIEEDGYRYWYEVSYTLDEYGGESYEVFNGNEYFESNEKELLSDIEYYVFNEDEDEDLN